MAKKKSTPARKVTRKKTSRTRTRKKSPGPVDTLSMREERTAGPADMNFFRPLRLQLGEGAIIKQPYRQHPWVHASIKRIAQSISGVPFRILKQSEEGDRDPDAFEALRRHHSSNLPDWIPQVHRKAPNKVYYQELRRRAPGAEFGLLCRASGVEPVESGEWYSLFRDVNPTMTRSMLWESSAINLNTAGEVYWVLLNNGAPITEKQVPTEIWVFTRDGWTPKVNEDTQVVEGWTLKVKGKDGQEDEKNFEPHQVIQFRYYDPANAVRGLAPYLPLERDVSVDHMASIFNEALLQNGALPSGVVTTDKPLSQDQVDEVLSEWEARHRGAVRSNRPAVLTGGMKWEQSKLTHREMEFFELRKWVRDGVLAVYGVPKQQLGLVEDVNRSTAQVAEKQFWNSTIIPTTSYIEDQLESSLFSPLTGGSIWGAFDYSSVEALSEEMQAKAETAKSLFEMSYPLNSINDRLDLGMENVDWGDTGYISSTMVPVGFDGTEEPPPEPEPEDDDDPGFTPGSDPDGQPPTDPPPDEGDEPVEALRILTDPHWYFLLHNAFVPGETALHSKYRRWLFELASEQMAIVDRADMNTTVMSDQLLFPLAAWEERIWELMVPVYTKVYERAEVQAEKEVDELEAKEKEAVSDSTERQHPDDGTFAEFLQLTNERIRRSVATTRRTLRIVLIEGLEQNETKAQIKERLRTAFGVLRNRSRTVARTESSATVNHGRRSTFNRRRVQYFNWLTAGDELVRTNHVLYGRAGDQPKGYNWAISSGNAYTLEFPHDRRAPPGETINCRCVLAPALPPL